MYPDPQYLIVNKTPSGGKKGSKNYWYPQDINSIKEDAIDEIRKSIGTDGTDNRKLGFCFSIPYLEKNVDSVVILNRLLNISLSKRMPVLIKLDGVSWWETRSDLWNWWDKNLSGYNPQNKDNVEWTSWKSDDAIKISWRNWGNQIRVKPHPNLGSKQYLKEKQEGLEKLIPIIASWYNNLPADNKYLMAGVVLDNELSIGLNHYYYPNGNSYINKDPKDDLRQKFNFSKGYTAGFVRLGFNTVKSYGIKRSGPLKLKDLNKSIFLHSQFLGQIALNCGLDFDKIYIHGLGSSIKNPDNTFSYLNVITPYGKPGWTIYDSSKNPVKSAKLTEAIEKLDGTCWGAVEWFLFKNKSGTSITRYWKDALSRMLNYPNNKLTVVYNWETISYRPKVIQAIKEVLQEESPDWLSPCGVLVKLYLWRWVSFKWKIPGNAEKLSLQISTKKDLTITGSLNDINVLNKDLTGLKEAGIFLKPGNYYYQITVETAKPYQKRFTRGSFIVPTFKDYITQRMEKVKNIFKFGGL